MKTFYFSHINGRISEDGKIVRGVSVITEGQAKGHDLYIDSKTLETLLEAAQAEKGGRVKTKLNHRGANGQPSGIESVFGYLSDFRIEGPKLLADLHLLKAHKEYDQTIEQIREIPEHIGLSVAFSGKPEVIDGKKFARAESIISTDLVPEPAANPTGMFEEGPFVGTDEVDTLNKEKMDPLQQILEKLSGLEDRLDQQDELIQSIAANGEGQDSLDLTEEDIAEAIEALRAEGYDDAAIEEILDAEIDAYYDQIEGVDDDGGDDEDGEEPARSIDTPSRGIAQGGGGGEPALAGVVGGSDASSEGAAFNQLSRMVTELSAKLEQQEAAAAQHELDTRFNAIQNRIAELAASNEQLAAENDALSAALRTNQPYTGLAPSAEVELSRTEGRFEALVQHHLSAGKTHSEAIQLSAKEDKGAHMDWLQRRGVLPKDLNVQA